MFGNTLNILSLLFVRQTQTWSRLQANECISKGGILFSQTSLCGGEFLKRLLFICVVRRLKEVFFICDDTSKDILINALCLIFGGIRSLFFSVTVEWDQCIIY